MLVSDEDFSSLEVKARSSRGLRLYREGTKTLKFFFLPTVAQAGVIVECGGYSFQGYLSRTDVVLHHLQTDACLHRMSFGLQGMNTSYCMVCIVLGL